MGNVWENGWHRKGTPLVKLLPYVEQAALYESLVMIADVDAQLWGDNATTSPPITGPAFPYPDVQMPAYRCPSDPYTNIANPPSNYGMNIGAQAMPGQNGCNLYPGNTFGNGGTGHGSDNDPAPNVSGVFSRYDFAAKMAQITDGTSNTIAIGEILPKCGDHHWGGWISANALWTATTAPINFPTCSGELPGFGGNPMPTPPPGSTACNWDRNWQTSQGFKSKHPVALCSCSATGPCTSSTRALTIVRTNGWVRETKANL